MGNQILIFNLKLQEKTQPYHPSAQDNQQTYQELIIDSGEMELWPIF